MSEPITKTIELTNLAINVENPRYDMVGNQREAIEVMVDDQENKLYNLAKDILANGLNPSELTIVSPHEKENGKFNVLEGNRRVTALKLLETPEIIGDKRKYYRQRFNKLSEEFKRKPITEVLCAVFEKPEDAYKWIKLKHTGQNEGVGTVQWDAQQTARFDEKIEGRSPIAIQALDFLSKSKSTDEHLRRKLKSVPSSSLVRLLEDKDVKEFLGLTIQDGILQTELKEEEVVKGLMKIVKDLLRSDFSVKDIYYKDDRLNYLETFEKHEIPDKTAKGKKPWQLTSPSSIGKIGDIKKRSKPLSTARKSIIPKEVILSISDTKTNQIYRELKRLECDTFVNAAAVLLRVFVELSVDAYVSAKRIQGLKKMTPLKEKIEKVTEQMENAGLASDHELKGIRTAVQNSHDVLSIDTFNSYVHNRYFTPAPKDLKIAWNNIERFIIRLWESV